MKNRIPLTVTLLAIVIVALACGRPGHQSDYALNKFGRLPILVNGRIKPLDTVARSTLLTIQGRQNVLLSRGPTLTPVEWLLDMFYRPSVADDYQVLEVVHPDVLALMGLSRDDGAGKKRFSLRQMAKNLGELDRQSKLADDTETAVRSPFQRAVIQLRDNVMLYQHLQSTFVAPGSDGFIERVVTLQNDLPGALAVMRTPGGTPAHDSAMAKLVLDLGREFSVMDSFSYLRPIPGAVSGGAQEWKTAGAAWSESLVTGILSVPARTFARIGLGWRTQDSLMFNQAVQENFESTSTIYPAVMTKSAVETRFNAAQPFYASSCLYVAAFLCAVISWLKWPDTLSRIAFGLLAVAFILTTSGIAVRMWLEGRPPVTNLYSSALFVGWGAVSLCLVLEYFYRNALGSAAAGLIGFAALLIAHHLALAGDTMEMMRAVLDSNFWLATHVVTVTVGYAATFLAGFLALIYVLRGRLTRSLDQATAEALSRMIYGVVCFATLFSFVGTVLGGIWADQSWGRFWGWDPKENGALLIVMWNSIILHARAGGLVGQRGLAILAILGNIVTAWSWFGVNMLGVGLHSYGFMAAAFWWLVVFVVSQLVVIAVASLPVNRWRSFRGPVAKTG
jgi:ABC-type transport system involved in cytochrome c biogenesis permease subunit